MVDMVNMVNMVDMMNMVNMVDMVNMVEDLMGSFGPTAGFSASLLGEPSPPSWLPCTYIFAVYCLYLSSTYIPCIFRVFPVV